ncbi:Protein of unknown function [Lactobacillus delbrueckii subsp. bulgaricus]|nr:Protein of unknown function [Lactobacillus delbrueckii subsp. bulgaricus]CDR74214.1 Protein of unknown function [Lactobacillus delbrueckii subsp. bulgaricus]CDR79709.1 Protein of unknown function [Lactobacillus delbrueckii subsp. lactis]CDR82765.1 Protein of unknown function [Lactobacillus delbrueckii subsp. lactis]
MKKLSKLTA